MLVIICQFQYPEHSVQSILSELEPYATLTEENIIKHNVEMKVGVQFSSKFNQLLYGYNFLAALVQGYHS